MRNGNIDILGTLSTNGDEYYTLESDVRTIVNNLRPDIGKVWCPFDTDESWFPKVLRESGYEVVNTHIDTGQDFFTTAPPAGVKCVVSNPPFSKKKDILKRLRSLGLPFCLILPFLFLNDGVPLDYGQQIMLFRYRVHFVMGGGRTQQTSHELLCAKQWTAKEELCCNRQQERGKRPNVAI